MGDDVVEKRDSEMERTSADEPREDPFVISDPGDPGDWPIGSHVVVPEFEDMHFFRPGSTGTVIRHADRRYLGVIVHLDQPFTCDHGHYQHVISEFSFNAVDLDAAPPSKGEPT